MKEHFTWAEESGTGLPSVPKGEERQNHQRKNSIRWKQADIIYLQRRCKISHWWYIISTTNMHDWSRRTQICCSGLHPERIYPDACTTQVGHGYHKNKSSTSGYYTRNSPRHLWALCDYISQGGEATSCTVPECHTRNNDGDYYVLTEIQEEPWSRGIWIKSLRPLRYQQDNRE